MCCLFSTKPSCICCIARMGTQHAPIVHDRHPYMPTWNYQGHPTPHDPDGQHVPISPP
jgi:hypothetical protein